MRILHERCASEDEMCRMLGISHDDLIDWSNRPPNDLDKESIERIVLIVAIADHLKVLFPKNHVRWPQLINTPMFGGETPDVHFGKGTGLGHPPRQTVARRLDILRAIERDFRVLAGIQNAEVS